MRREPPYQRHSETSIDAADKISSASGKLRKQVYMYIRLCGIDGATDEEIQMALSMEGSTKRPRRVELFNDALIVDSGRKRNTKSGRSAVVWMARDFTN